MEKSKRSKPKIFDPAYMTHYLEIKGAVNSPLRITAEELSAMKLTEVRDLTMICGSGRNEGFIQSYRGVLLTDLLVRADIMKGKHDSRSYMYVTVHSSDGYLALFSYQELFNSSIGERAIVIIEKDGQPLDEQEGRIAFISANDKRLGARKLRYVKSVVVHEHHWDKGSD